MSLLHLPDAVNSKNLQIWNNAVFDDAAGVSDVAAAKLLQSSLQPISANQSESLDFDPCKENRSPTPVYDKTPISKKSSSTALKPAAISGKSSKVSFKEDAQINDESIDDEIEEIEKEIRRLSSRLEALRIKKAERDSTFAAARRHGRIVPAKFMDPKQSTIKILDMPASKKMGQSPSSTKLRQRCGSLGPLEIIAISPKVLDLKQSSTKNLGSSSSSLKKIEESPASTRLQRRGVSLGPLEIHESVRSRQLKALEATTLRSVQIQMKQGFWKLEGIQEEKGKRRSSRPSIAAKASVPRKAPTTTIATKKVAESPTNTRLQRRGVSLGPSEIAMSARSRQIRKIQEVKEKGMKAEKQGRSLSTSPRSRRSSAAAAKVSDLRKGIATVGAKKPVKKEEGSLASLKPKVLFHEGKNTILAKRPSKNTRARVVASRYSLAATTRVAGDEPGSSRRKWSLPELGMDETDGSLQGSHGSVHESQEELGVQMKRGGGEMSSKVEGNVVDHLLSVDENSPPSIKKIAESLPKIKTLRCIIESPRDSGCAKRVAELVGKRPVFGEADDEDVASPCQALTFGEEE